MKTTKAFLLFVIALTSCSPRATTSMIAPTETTVATATVEPTITSTSIPTIQMDGMSVPDPRATNPELFDLSSPDSPIPQFINAMKLAGIELNSQQIIDAFNDANNFQVETDVSGKQYTQFIYAIEHNGVSYSMGFAYDKKNGWGETTLRELAERNNIEIGTLITKSNSVPGLNDLDLERLESSQFNLGLISLYWPGMEEQQNSIDASSRISAANFAKQNSMDTIGHLLIWGKDIPTWLKTGNFSRDEIIEIMKTRIKNTIEIMAKQGVYSYVVVNEAGSGDDYFMRKIGKDYIEIAFQAARDTGKELGVPLTLIYNDYSNDTPGGSRTEITQEIVNELKGKGLIDAVGLEMIVSYPENPSEAEMIQAMQAYGLLVIITEAAVNMGNFKGDSTEKSIVQSQIYRKIFSAAMKSGVCTKIIVFTAIDDISPWVTEKALDGYSPDNAPSMFYLNNGLITTKPAYYAALQALMEKQKLISFLVFGPPTTLRAASAANGVAISTNHQRANCMTTRDCFVASFSSTRSCGGAGVTFEKD